MTAGSIAATRSMVDLGWVGVFLVAIAAEGLLSPVPAPIATTAILAIVAAGLIVERRLGVGVLVTLTLCLALPHVLGGYVTTKPFGVFAADLVVIPLLVAGALRMPRVRQWPPYVVHFMFIVAAGVGLTWLGMENGHAFLDAIGVFRRLCVYPLVFLVAVALTRTTPLPLLTLERGVVAAALLITAIVAGRLITGEGYAHEYMEGIGVPDRFLSHLEAICVVFVSMLALGHLVAEKRHRGRWMALVGVLLLCVVASNYRTVWVAFLVATAVWAWTSDQPVGRMMAIGAVVAVLAVGGGMFIVWQVDPSSLPLERFSPENLRRGVSWRWGSWSRAIEVFVDSPVFGTGFGYRHEFKYLTGANFDIWHVSKGHTIHNDLLWVLVNGGIVGAVFIVGLHVRWWGLCLQSLFPLNRHTAEARFIAAALATHSAAVVLSMFQPFFSSPTAVVALYLIMGIALVLAQRLKSQAVAVVAPMMARDVD